MQFKKLAVIGVVLLVALSGCTSLGGFGAGDSPNETQPEGEDPSENTSENDTDENDSPNESQDAEDDSDGDDSTDDANGEDDESTQSSWSPPQQPNMPLEWKDESSTRIKSVEFVDKVEAENGEGYSNFNIEIVANTSMEDVDPPEYGNVIGEPYFFVKINEGEGNRKIVERTGQVEMTENGTFHIEVRPGGLEEFGENERLTVEVFLMDEDKQYDDIYGAVSKPIHFNPDVESDSSEEDSNEDTDETESDEADDSNESDETDGTDGDADDTNGTNETDESNDTSESDGTDDANQTDDTNETDDTTENETSD